MRIQVDKHAALVAAKRAERSAQKGGGSAILGYLRVDAADDRVTFSGASPTIFAHVVAECEVETPGSICIDASTLVRVIESAGDGSIALSVIDGLRLQVASGRRTATVAGVRADDFPALPALGDWQEIGLPSLREVLAAVAYAASADEARQALTIVHLAQTYAVATDGHRLAKVAADMPCSGNLPRKLVLEWLANKTDAQTAELGRSDEAVALRIDGSTFGGRLANVTPPPYSQVIPKHRMRAVTIARKPFADAIRAAVACAPKETTTVRLSVGSSTVEIAADDPDRARSMTDAIDCEVDGIPLVIGVSGTYLAESLEHMHGETVQMEMIGELDPITLKQGNATHVVMPMRI